MCSRTPQPSLWGTLLGLSKSRERAVKARQEASAEAKRLSMQGHSYYIGGRYGESEPLLERSLAIWEEVLDPDDRRVARSLHSLAQVYQVQGRYADAERLLERSLAIWWLIRNRPIGRPWPDSLPAR